MKINFCLPGISRKPIGGYKIVFEYANRLSRLGHDVTVTFIVEKQFKKIYGPEFLKKYIFKILNIYYPRWFKLDNKVEKRLFFGINDNFIKSDAIFCTSINTVEYVNKAKKEYGEKFYLIQGFENWDFSDDEVINSYKLGINNIVVSNWLYEIVNKYSKNNVTIIKNPIDLNEFYILNTPENRNKYSIGALYHESYLKGFDILLEAIKKAKIIYPEIKLHLFGAHDLPKSLKKINWISFKKNIKSKELNSLYNSCAIFLCASRYEGFGLTGAESMASGCTLVTTGFKGVFEYANNNNAIISPIENIELLYRNIVFAIEDDDYRNKIAYNGFYSIREYTWDDAVKLMEKKILDVIRKV